MNPPEQSGLRWIKAQKSVGTGACVELATDRGDILLRNSRNPAVHLRYSLLEIDAFLDGAKRGEFDHLLAQD
jgi:hypothetical protein